MTERDESTLPDVTSDEQDVGWGDDIDDDDADRLLHERPPHHDRD